MSWVTAFRMLRRHPAFAAAAILTLGLGLGATTVVFSVVEAVLLRPLPYGDPDRLVFVWQDLRARGVARFGFSHGDFGDLQAQSPSLAGTAAISTDRQTLLHDDGTPELIETGSATANVFDVLGVRVAAGRPFAAADGLAAEDRPSTAVAAPLAGIISHTFWQRRFGGSPSAIGRVLRLDDGAVEVVGVLPPEFELLAPSEADIAPRPDLWVALRTNFATGQRAFAPFTAIGRLAPTATLADARRDMAALTADLRTRFRVKQTADVHVVTVPMRDEVVGEVQPTLLALMGAVTFVLLIACANVAGLLLARAHRRTQELAVRAALGGSRGRLVAQLLAESVVVAASGGLVGLGLASGALAALRAYGPAQVPRLASAALNPQVVFFTAGAGLLSAVVFGLLPATQMSRVSLLDVLRQGGRSGGLARHPLRNGLITAEVALSFVLLVGSGLMVRSIVALQQTDPGFDARGVYTFLVPRPLGDTPALREARTRLLRDRLAGLAGVTDVTVTSALPLDGTDFTGPYGPLDAAAQPDLMRQGEHRIVAPGYFRALRTPIVEGREFTEADSRPDVNVVVVDEELARALFPGASAVGRRMLVPRVLGEAQPEPFEIVGVSRAQHSTTLARAGRATLFLPAGRVGWNRTVRWAVRTSGEPSTLAGPIRAEVAKVDATLALGEAQPLTAFVAAAMAPTQFVLTMMGAFGLLATVLAVVGLYGVLSTVVADRTAEIGVRVALGASRSWVFGLVLGHGLTLAGLGLASGLALALLLTRALGAVLVGVSPTDPLTFVLVALVFLAVVAAACAVPSWRAARLDPVSALRQGA